MKNTLLAAILLLAQPLCAEDERRFEVVHCGSDTVVEFANTQSPDGKFAFGWTIRPVADDAKPVDWVRFEKEGEASFRGFILEEEDSNRKPTHRIVHGVIDLRSKSFKPTPIVETRWNKGGHFRTEAKWVDEKHAIILMNSKFQTDDAFFLHPAGDQLEASSLLPKMNEQIGELIREIRPLAPEASQMVISYGLRDYKETIKSSGNTVFCSVENGIIHVPFWAYRPRRATIEDIEGHLLISIKDGKLLKAISKSPVDRPFVGELGQADKRLNEVYGKLRKQSGGDNLNRLISDQLKWIERRKSEAFSNGYEAIITLGETTHTEDEGTMSKAYRNARDAKALELTRERTEVLQKQLDAVSSK